MISPAVAWGVVMAKCPGTATHGVRTVPVVEFPGLAEWTGEIRSPKPAQAFPNWGKGLTRLTSRDRTAPPAAWVTSCGTVPWRGTKEPSRIAITTWAASSCAGSYRQTGGPLEAKC